MERRELYDAWQANKHRPQWVRANREAIHEHTDLSEPIPTSGTAAVADWLDRYKGTVTRQLDDDADGTDPENETTTEASA